MTFTWEVNSYDASFTPDATLSLFLNENQNILSGAGSDDIGSYYTTTWISYN